MTTQGAQHIIEVLNKVRKELMKKGIVEPFTMQEIQECITLCREEVARKMEKAS